jgi:hypothetical protein
MLGPSLHRLTTWLCLVATLLMGISPGQALVLCLEPNGGVTVELASDANRCGGCPDDASGSREGTVPAADHPDCPCIDIPLVLGGKQDQLELKQVDLPVSPPAALPAATVLTLEPAVVTCQSRSDTPRPAQSLALIRSVVLLV